MQSPAMQGRVSGRSSISSRHLRNGPTLLVRAQASQVTADKAQPDWTGDKGLSRLVNWMINTPPLYAVMKVLAKSAMKSSAEGRGISWDKHVQTLSKTAELEQIRQQLEDKSVTYPDYYLQPFHAYPEGNLSWLAAYECEPATYAMAIRTFKSETSLTPEAAYMRLRTGITDAIKGYIVKHGLQQPRTIIDMGCSVGLSTQWLAQEFPQASVTGMDLSPHFLAVAELRERQAEADGSLAASGRQRITYAHRQAEANGLDQHSVDMLAFNFVIHECPQQAIRDFVAEGLRVVKPGGMLVFVDNNPRSKTIQNLPPALFTLMKSTEPWSDEYYSFDLEECMRDAGFGEVITVESDHRHRTVMGIAPRRQ